MLQCASAVGNWQIYFPSHFFLVKNLYKICRNKAINLFEIIFVYLLFSLCKKLIIFDPWAGKCQQILHSVMKQFIRINCNSWYCFFGFFTKCYTFLKTCKELTHKELFIYFEKGHKKVQLLLRIISNYVFLSAMSSSRSYVVNPSVGSSFSHLISIFLKKNLWSFKAL
jgi:hypothetical protein